MAKNILIVEDDEFFRELVTKALVTAVLEDKVVLGVFTEAKNIHFKTGAVVNSEDIRQRKDKRTEK